MFSLTIEVVDMIEGGIFRYNLRLFKVPEALCPGIFTNYPF